MAGGVDLSGRDATRQSLEANEAKENDPELREVRALIDAGILPSTYNNRLSRAYVLQAINHLRQGASGPDRLELDLLEMQIDPPVPASMDNDRVDWRSYLARKPHLKTSASFLGMNPDAPGDPDASGASAGAPATNAAMTDQVESPASSTKEKVPVAGSRGGPGNMPYPQERVDYKGAPESGQPVVPGSTPDDPLPTPSKGPPVAKPAQPMELINRSPPEIRALIRAYKDRPYFTLPDGTPADTSTLAKWIDVASDYYKQMAERGEAKDLFWDWLEKSHVRQIVGTPNNQPANKAGDPGKRGRLANPDLDTEIFEGEVRTTPPRTEPNDPHWATRTKTTPTTLRSAGSLAGGLAKGIGGGLLADLGVQVGLAEMTDRDAIASLLDIVYNMDSQGSRSLPQKEAVAVSKGISKSAPKPAAEPPASKPGLAPGRTQADEQRLDSTLDELGKGSDIPPAKPVSIGDKEQAATRKAMVSSAAAPAHLKPKVRELWETLSPEEREVQLREAARGN